MQPRGFGNPWLQLMLSQCCTLAAELMSQVRRVESHARRTRVVLDWPNESWFALCLARHRLHDPELHHLALCSATSGLVRRLSRLPSRARDGSPGSWIVLAEKINAVRWSGIALVIVGLFLVAKPVAKMEERL